MLSQTLPMNPVSVLGSTPASHTGGSPASTAPSFAPVAGGYGSPSRSAPSGWAPTILWAVVSLVPSAPGLQLTSASLNNVTVRIHQYQIIPKASPSIPLHAQWAAAGAKCRLCVPISLPDHSGRVPHLPTILRAPPTIL